MHKILTISVAAYNVDKYIRELIESVVQSSMSEKIEILIIDDGSNDNTYKIAKEYSDKYDSVSVITKENGGYGSTVNVSLKLAQGKYFKLLDGDDIFQIENIDKYIEYLERCDSDIVLTPYIRFSELENIEKLIDRHNISENTMFIEDCDCKEIEDIHMAELAVKTENLKKFNTKITENCFYTDNEIVFFALLYSKTISKFKLPIYRYRIGVMGQSVSIEGKIKHYKDGFIVEKKMLNIFYNKQKKLGKNVSNSIEAMIVNLTLFNYKNIITLKNSGYHRKEIKEFDTMLKFYNKNIYYKTFSSNTVKFLRIFNFHGLNIVHTWQNFRNKKFTKSKG